MHNESWTDETDALVTRLRRDERLSAKVIAARVGRSPGAVSARLLKLGVTIHARIEWGVADAERLSALLADPAKTVRGIAREMGRTECSVRWKIDDLGLKPGRLRPWTSGDDAIALAASQGPEAARRAAAETLGRTFEAFQARLVHLGVRQKESWDAKSESRLAELVAAGATLAEAAADLGRDAGAVRSKGYAAGLRFRASPDARLPWSQADDARLGEMAQDLGAGKRAVAAMSAALGRSERSVSVRLRGLGRSTGRRRRAMDDAGRLEIVEAAREGLSLKEAILTLGRDARTLKSVAEAAGVSFSRPPRPVAAPRRAVAKPQSFGGGNLPGRVIYVAPRAKADRREAERRQAEDRAGMADAIARFMRDKGVSRASPDPATETVRLVRARGYTVTGAPDDGYLVDGRHRLGDVDALVAFARARGIASPMAGVE